MKPFRATRTKIDPIYLRSECERVVQSISAHIHPVSIILFGSSAREEGTDQSDIDLLILGESDEDIHRMRTLLRPLRPLSKSFPVELIWMKKSEFDRKKDIGGLAAVIKDEGVVLYTNKDTYDKGA